jgi:hypothetical protein
MSLMADSLADTPLIDLMKKAGLPITRQSFIEVCWGDNPPQPWDAEAEDQIPIELQDWSWLPSSGAEPDESGSSYAPSDIPDPPEDDDDEDEDDEDEDEDDEEDTEDEGFDEDDIRSSP